MKLTDDLDARKSLGKKVETPDGQPGEIVAYAKMRNPMTLETEYMFVVNSHGQQTKWRASSLKEWKDES